MSLIYNAITCGLPPTAEESPQQAGSGRVARQQVCWGMHVSVCCQWLYRQVLVSQPHNKRAWMPMTKVLPRNHFKPPEVPLQVSTPAVMALGAAVFGPVLLGPQA